MTFHLPAWWRRASLRTKTLVVIGFTATLMVGLMYGALSLIIFRSYLSLEEQSADTSIERVHETIVRELATLNSKVGDWANWDDAYNFVQHPNPEFPKDNATDTTFRVLSVNTILFVNNSAHIVFLKGRDLTTQQDATASAWWQANITPSSPILQHDQNKYTTGIVMVDDKPMLFAARPILTSNFQGPVAGTLLFGYYLDSSVVKQLINELESPLTFYGYEHATGSLASIKNELRSAPSGVVLTRPDANTIFAYTLIIDVYGNPVLILKETLPRDVYKFGRQSMTAFTVMMTGFGLILVIFILALLERFVLRRLFRLSGEVADIGTKGSLASRVTPLGDDELGFLAANINKSMAEIEKVTNEKEYQQKQKESILEIMGEGVLMTGPDNTIMYVNSSLTRLMGYPLDELKGKEFSRIFKISDLNDKPLPDNYLDEANKQSSEGSVVWVYLTGKDQKVPVIINTAKIVVNGKTEGIVRTIYDYRPELEKLKQKDDFFSFASHELRTPLTIIKGNLLAVLEGFGGSKLTKDDTESLTDATDSSRRLIKLVNEFLNVSRIDQGRVQVNVADVDICQLTAEVVKELTPLYTDKGLSLSFTCSPPPVIVKADRDKLKEVIINLLGNSVKFTEKGGVTITHEVKGDTVFFHFIDTGMGIPEERAKHLFDRFQRATDEQGAKNIEGSGLGLFICRQFMTLMKGDVWIEKTKMGEGTTFALTIPVSDKQTPPPPAS